MTFGESIRTCFHSYATFSGRAPRSEYWFFVLFVWLVSSGFSMVDGAIWGPTLSEFTEATRDASGAVQTTTGVTAEYGGGPLSSLWGLLTLLPLTAAGWRRLHDTGRPGWYLLLPWIMMIAIVLGLFTAMGAFSGGWATAQAGLSQLEDFGGGLFALGIVAAFIPFIVLLVFLCQRSQPGPNPYGPNPSEVTP